MNPNSLPNTISAVVEAAHAKKASAITVLSLAGFGAFAEYFVICSAESVRQIEAVGDEIEKRLRDVGLRLPHREGRAGTEWLLLDYGTFVVHVFSQKARAFYDIERLWRAAQRIDIPELGQTAAGTAS